MKIVATRRFANSGTFQEFHPVTGEPITGLLESGFFEVSESDYTELDTRDLVISQWTGKKILPDGDAPAYNSGAGPDAALTKVFSSDTVPSGAQIQDKTIQFQWADYGWKNDGGTAIPVPA